MKRQEKKSGEKSNKLLPSHYYMDENKLVFTEEYHKERGYCCGNGCRHCPYIPTNNKGNTTLKN
jgi:hypothetical protein